MLLAYTTLSYYMFNRPGVVGARDLTCCMSGVRCQVSGVRCQCYMSHDTIFLYKVVERVYGGSVIKGAYPV